MQTHQRSRATSRQFNVVSFVRRTSVVATFGLLCVANVFGANVVGVVAQTRSSACTNNPDRVQILDESVFAAKPVVMDGSASTSRVALRGSRANGDSQYTGQAICTSNRLSLQSAFSYSVPVVHQYTLRIDALQIAHTQVTGQAPYTAMSADDTQSSSDDDGSQDAAVGTRNTFPYGECTWWADQRYHQLHGVFVPWYRSANAGQWAVQASNYGWHVSGDPQVGDILVLQPNVQGAGSVGHVAVVEQVLSNGHVVASSMNWGINPRAVSHYQFVPGPGVAFVEM